MMDEKGNMDSLKQLQMLHEHDPFFGELFSGHFKDLAEELLGGPAVGKNMQYFNKPPGTNKETPAHQDGFYFMLKDETKVDLSLTGWLALDSADTENGCLHYVLGSHQRGMRPHDLSGILGFSQRITDFPQACDAQHEVPMNAEPGDLIVHSGLMIHRAGRNLSERQRRAVGFIYYSAAAEVDEERAARYQKENYERNVKLGLQGEKGTSRALKHTH